MKCLKRQKKTALKRDISLAIGKIKEYPTCDLLLGNVAMLLNGLLLFQGNRIDSYEKYEEEIEALFQRVMQSDRIDIREQAQAYLISKLMEKQDYEQAQKVLDTISKKRVLDREQLQANLYIAQGELEKAGKADRRKVFVCHNRNSRGADDVNGDRIERKADGRRGIYCGYRQAGGAGI